MKIFTLNHGILKETSKKKNKQETVLYYNNESLHETEIKTDTHTYIHTHTRLEAWTFQQYKHVDIFVMYQYE